jgi:hypothetical protein
MRPNVRYLAPYGTSPLARRLSWEVVSLTIKGNWQQSHSRPHSEYLIDYFAPRFDPTWKAEIAKRWEDEIRKPIPAKRDAKCHSEQGIVRHFPRIVTAIHQFHCTETAIPGSLPLLHLFLIDMV